MYTLSTNYTLKWQIKFANNYQFTSCKKLINLKRGKVVKKCVNGGCVGYCINGKFYSTTYLKLQIELIDKIITPF